MKKARFMSIISRSVTFMLFLCSSWQSVAACWEITDSEGHISEARDIWQLKSRFDEQSTLMVTTDGSDERILVEDIQSLDIRKKEEGGWFRNWGQNEAEINITFRDGHTDSFHSTLNLFVLAGEEPHQVTFNSIASITRCKSVIASPGQPSLQHKDPSGIVEYSIAKSDNLPSTVRVYMRNGDILDGIFLAEEVIWKTDYALLSMGQGQIKSIKFLDDPENNWMIILKIGSKVTGAWIDKSIEVDLFFGNTITIDSKLIREIIFSEPE